LALTCIAGILLAIGAVDTHLVFGDYGLIHGLSAVYLAGLGVLVVAAGLVWWRDDEHPRLLVVQLVALVVALWLAPLFAEGSHPATDHALRSLGLIDYIARTGDISGDTIPYLGWSGAYIIPGYLSRWFGWSYEAWIDYAPFITQLLCIPPLYAFLRNVTSKSKYLYMGMWIFFLANWTASDYLFSSVGLATVLLLTLMALVTRHSLWEPGRSHKKTLILICLVFGLLAATHLLISLVALLMLSAVIIIKRKAYIVYATVICALLLVTWSTTNADRYVSYLLDNTGMLSSVDSNEDETSSFSTPELPTLATGAALVVNPADTLEGQVFTFISGNDAHKQVALIRVLYSGIFILIAGIGVTVALRRRRGDRRVFPLLLMGTLPLTLIVLPYAGRMAQRLYLVALPFIAYFVIRLVLARPKVVVPVLCVIILLCIPTHFVTHYGNQEYDHVSDAHLEGLRYFHDNTNSDNPYNYIVGLPRPWLMRDLESVCIIPIDWLNYSDGVITNTDGWTYLNWWVIITKQDRAFYDLVCDAPDYVDEVEKVLMSAENVILRYSNEDFSWYEIRMEDLSE